MNLGNWVIIHPHSQKDMITKQFEGLRLKDFTVAIIVINDSLNQKQEDEYSDFINENLSYGGYLEFSKEKELTKMIEVMGGVTGDELFFIKEGKVIHKKLELDSNDENA